MQSYYTNAIPCKALTHTLTPSSLTVLLVYYPVNYHKILVYNFKCNTGRQAKHLIDTSSSEISWAVIELESHHINTH